MIDNAGIRTYAFHIIRWGSSYMRTEAVVFVPPCPYFKTTAAGYPIERKRENNEKNNYHAPAGPDGGRI